MIQLKINFYSGQIYLLITISRIVFIRERWLMKSPMEKGSIPVRRKAIS